MAYSDPQTITINAIANSLPRTASGVNTGTFTKDDGNVRLSVSHAYGKRNRRQSRLDVQKVAPDPLISSTNILYGMSVYLVVDAPKTGYTIAEQKQAVDGFLAYLSASSGANITKLLGGEN
jgi:hypothetical protein